MQIKVTGSLCLGTYQGLHFYLGGAFLDLLETTARLGSLQLVLKASRYLPGMTCFARLRLVETRPFRSIQSRSTNQGSKTAEVTVTQFHCCCPSS